MRYLYLLPAGLLLFGVLGVPLTVTLAAGMGHYREVLRDPTLGAVTTTTLAFTIVTVTAELVLGLAFALILHAVPRVRGPLRATALLPWALPSAVMAMAWRWIFDDTYGVAGQVLVTLGLLDQPIAWLGRPGTAFLAVVMADVWKSTPFVTIILLAGLQSIPAELDEAMSIDGAGVVRRFWWLTLPLLGPAIGIALIFRLVQAIAVFDVVWVMTGGGPANSTRTVALYIYDTVFRYVRPESGAAITGLVVLVMLILAGGAGAFVRQRAAP